MLRFTQANARSGSLSSSAGSGCERPIRGASSGSRPSPVRAASVNPVDFKIRSGKYPAVKNDRLPYTLGCDMSGIVEKCGAQATRFKIGDEVFGMIGIHGGGYSEQAVVGQNAIAAKPSGLDHVHATAIPLAGLMAWQGLFRHGRLNEGQSVLIHGG